MQIRWICLQFQKLRCAEQTGSPVEYGVMREAKCLILRYVPFRIAFAQIFGILLSGSGVCLQPYSMSLGGNISNN